MSVVAIWVVSVLGLTTIILFMTVWTERSARGDRRPAHQEEAYRPVQAGQVSVAEGDDQAILDHQRLVEQYKDMIDELYSYGEQVVRRSEAGRE